MAGAPVVSRLAPEDCLDLLGGAAVGRVAVCVGALPAIRTVRFALAGGHIVFRVAPRSTLSRAAAGVVAFHVDHYDPEALEGWCVQVVGHSEAVTEPSLLTELGRLPLEAWTPTAESDLFFRVPLASISGQRIRWPKR